MIGKPVPITRTAFARMLITLIVLTCVPGGVSFTADAADDRTAYNPLHDLYTFNQEQFGSFYQQTVQEWERTGIPDSAASFQIKAVDYTGKSEQAVLNVGTYDKRDAVLIWKNNRENWIEYELQVPEPGLYEMEITYHAYQPPESESLNYKPVFLAITVDGAFPFREARSIKLPGQFHDVLPLQKDAYGDHIRPRPVELEDWIDLPVTDHQDSYPYPLKWYFPEGTHTLRLQGNSSIVLDTISFKPPGTVPAYEEVVTTYEGMSSAGGGAVKIEGEFADVRNEVSIQMVSDQDALMSPKAEGRRIFNAIGGSRWAEGGRTVTWQFEVPESGLYKLAFRALNNLYSNKTSFHKIRIDGEVPFAEMIAYGIPYSNTWEQVVLKDSQGEPYAFYLEKGVHTLSMSATYAPFKPVQVMLEQVLQQLGIVSRDLQVLTKGELDLNRTWDIEANFPEIPQSLSGIRDVMSSMAAEWLTANGRIDSNYQVLMTAVKDLEALIRYPDEIPYHMDSLSLVQSKVGALTTVLTASPVALDYVVIAPYEDRFPRMTANSWEKIQASVMNFFHSFRQDSRMSGNEENVLNVWMAFGRDYVNLLQELADQYFTPETGITVKVDLLPREDLLVLANAANNTPDVALGISEGRPSEFAFRDAAVDLSQYPGFDALIADFSPGAMLPYYYNGGFYALPETQHLKLLYYRKDIMDRLGLDVPDTWEDVYDMLPTLQQQGYNFFLPQTDFLTYIYQNDADFYADDGLISGLSSPQGFQAFKQMTELFSIYGIDRQVSSFYQHFRDGDMPIGISDLNTYLQLLVAAPELTGWWGMAPLPGIMNEQGIVERWSGGNIGMLAEGLGGFGGAAVASGGGSQTAAMIMEKSQNKQWAWEFIRWWLSSATQEQFGNELEGFYGESFRWNTANLAAFTRLPWTQEELDPILEQWSWYKSIVNVPGSYFVPRELTNAWNRTVLDGMNYRASLEIALLNINREMLRKQREFGYRGEDGAAVKSFGLPQYNEPWSGVERYVRH